VYSKLAHDPVTSLYLDQYRETSVLVETVKSPDDLKYFIVCALKLSYTYNDVSKASKEKGTYTF